MLFIYCWSLFLDLRLDCMIEELTDYGTAVWAFLPWMPNPTLYDLMCLPLELPVIVYIFITAALVNSWSSCAYTFWLDWAKALNGSGIFRCWLFYWLPITSPPLKGYCFLSADNSGVRFLFGDASRVLNCSALYNLAYWWSLASKRVECSLLGLVPSVYYSYTD